MSEPVGVDRRGFLQCMAWTGTGLLWSVAGGVLCSKAIGAGRAEAADAASAPTFSFAQISDTHIGFKGEANRDVMATFEAAISRIKAHGFGVSEVTVPVGTTVTWINHDDDPHTVTSTTNIFRSPGLDTDETWAYTFTRPGTYEYYCTLHPLMTGKVIVRSAS